MDEKTKTFLDKLNAEISLYQEYKMLKLSWCTHPSIKDIKEDDFFYIENLSDITYCSPSSLKQSSIKQLKKIIRTAKCYYKKITKRFKNINLEICIYLRELVEMAKIYLKSKRKERLYGFFSFLKFKEKWLMFI